MWSVEEVVSPCPRRFLSQLCRTECFLVWRLARGASLIASFQLGKTAPKSMISAQQSVFATEVLLTFCLLWTTSLVVSQFLLSHVSPSFCHLSFLHPGVTDLLLTSLEAFSTKCFYPLVALLHWKNPMRIYVVPPAPQNLKKTQYLQEMPVVYPQC